MFRAAWLLIVCALPFSASVQAQVQNPASQRADWPGYVPRQAPFSNCPGPQDPRGACFAFNVPWDARKNQHVNFYYRFDPSTGRLRILHRLYNRHPTDGDHVAFTALFQDAKGETLFIFHQHWGVNPRQVREEIFDYELPPSTGRHIKNVWMAFKQTNLMQDQEIIRRALEPAAVLCGSVTGNPALCKAAAEAAKRTMEKR
jgi:hypothetical protein